MQRLTNRLTPATLVSMFVVLAVLPLGVMGWLGKKVLDQERELEQQRREDRLENAANELADTFSKIVSPSVNLQLPSGVSWVLFDTRGVIAHRGFPLRYFPQVVRPEKTSLDVFQSAELIEFKEGNPARVVERYRALAAHPDDGIRAAATFRLGSALARQGKTADALAAYEDLAAFGATPIAGDAAEILARRYRADIFELVGNTDAASAERRKLSMLLSAGRYTLDQRTFTFYGEGLSLQPSVPDLTSAVADLWPRWQAQPTGRQTWTNDGIAFASVWAPFPQGTVALIGFAAPDAIADQQSVADRRNLLIAGFGLMTLVIVVAGYFGVRSLHRELSVARLQSDFVAQVSHEFRTPLTAMRHLTDLLEQGSASADRLPQFYQALGKETRRLHSMVESLLDFGRIESGRHVYTLEDVDMADVAERVVSERGSNRVRLTTAAGAPRIRADREALVLAVRNLLDNAIKYSPESSAIDVRVESREGTVGISVQDRGAGMSPAEQRDIRRKFVRGSAARLMNVKGTGIGLAIVEQVARAHGGRLDLHSEPGRGSRFTLWIPALEHSS
jgi:signal transduction histidine kinase